MPASYIIEGNLSEPQIEADVAQYLGWCAKDLPFRLLDVDESLTGADKLSDVAVPIYIQFKKSTGLQSVEKFPIKSRKNESSLQSIRRFRNKHGLPENPSLFFALRKQAKTAVDLQHNILLSQNKPPLSYAIYVAPLDLDAKVYSETLCMGPRFERNPWSWRLSELRSSMDLDAMLRRFDLQPFLRNHISISPHQKVSDHKHHYAYSNAGCSVTWHSGEVVERGTSRLSEFLSQRTRQILLPYYELPTPEQGLSVAQELVSSLEISSDQIFVGDETLEKLSGFGRWLWKEHNIRQTLILGKRREIEAIRSLAR